MFGVEECTCSSGSCDTCDDPICECPLHTFEMKEEYPVSPVVLSFLTLSPEEQMRDLEISCLLAESCRERASFYLRFAVIRGNKEEEEVIKSYVYDNQYMP